MRLLPLLLCSALLGGCASTSPNDPNGTWINQAAIDAALQHDSLREALLAYGPNLEWQVDGPRQRASFSNGFERAEGQLSRTPNGGYRVTFYGDFEEQLQLERGELIQAASDTWPEQRFIRADHSVLTPAGSLFEQALYRAYLGGTWLIEQGLGQGGLVLFQADGSLQGLPGAERYALCLAGDCAAMSGEHDSLWLQLGTQGQSWLFERAGAELRIYQALNRAAIDEMPDHHKGPLHWRLRRRE